MRPFVVDRHLVRRDFERFSWQVMPIIMAIVRMGVAHHAGVGSRDIGWIQRLRGHPWPAFFKVQAEPFNS